MTYDEERINKLINLAGYANLKSIDNIYESIIIPYVKRNSKDDDDLEKYNTIICTAKFDGILCMLNTLLNTCTGEVNCIKYITVFVGTLKRVFPLEDTSVT